MNLRYRVMALATPGMATADTLGGKPAAPERPIARPCSDRIGGAGRLIAAAWREHSRGTQLPTAGEQNEGAGDHLEPTGLIPGKAGTRFKNSPPSAKCTGWILALAALTARARVTDAPFVAPWQAPPEARRSRARPRQHDRSLRDPHRRSPPPRGPLSRGRGSGASCGCGPLPRRSCG